MAVFAEGGVNFPDRRDPERYEENLCFAKNFYPGRKWTIREERGGHGETIRKMSRAWSISNGGLTTVSPTAGIGDPAVPGEGYNGVDGAKLAAEYRAGPSLVFVSVTSPTQIAFGYYTRNVGIILGHYLAVGPAATLFLY